MVTLLIVFIFCLAFFTVVFFRMEGYYSGATFMGSVTITLLVTFIVIGVIGGVGTYKATVDFESRTEIYSLFNDSSLEGRFYLFHGSIDQRDMVYYWVVNERGAYVKKELPMEKSEFVEDQTNSGHIITHWKLCSDEYNENGWSKWDYCEPRVVRYTFHIPKNSIYYGFEVK